MKKFSLILIALVLICSIAHAELALKDYSYDQLVALQKEITAEIMSRPEWKEVEVPAGTWVVGEDIPAGKYSVKPAKESITIVFEVYKDANDKYGEPIIILDVLGKIDLKDGMIIKTNYATIFSPSLGLGF